MAITDIKEHLVLVTGAASGIGKQIAVSLSKKGAIIAACDKNLAGLQKIKSEINSENFHIFEIDFASKSSIEGCVIKVESELGPLKAVVNCAGVLGKNGEKVESLDIDDFDLVYSINLRGAVILTKAVIKGMSDRGYGRILHMASISGKEGNPLLVAYSSSKAGLIAMVKSVGDRKSVV